MRQNLVRKPAQKKDVPVVQRMIRVVVVPFFLAALAIGLSACLAPEQECGGRIGCPCDTDGHCPIDGQCVSGVCIARAVRAPVVDVGDVGQPCYANNSCNPGGLCADSVCIACDAGSAGCACFGNDTCVDGLACGGGVCRSSSSGLLPPANPKCYSPCTSSFTKTDGTFVQCDANGLMAGCRGTNACANGTCVPAQQSSTATLSVDGSCDSDLDCTDYGACIQGSCYAMCDVDQECNDVVATASGMQPRTAAVDSNTPAKDTDCHRHVCRQPCDTATLCLDTSTFCDAPTGGQGHCMPKAAATGTPVVPPNDFIVSKLSIRFTNTNVNDEFVLVNEGVQPETFTVEKISGDEIVAGQPLHWLEMGCTSGCTAGTAGTSQVQSFTVSVDGAGSEATISLRSAGNPNVNNWNGVLRVTGQRSGARDVVLSYFSEPDGQWAGKMFYFANFPDRCIFAGTSIAGAPCGGWVGDKSNADAVLALDNALLRKWIDFAGGNLSLDEFEAIIQSTQSASWRTPLMAELCPNSDGACYPYDNNNGYGVFTSSLDSIDIPTGGSELPFVMNLRRDDVDPTVLVGRVETKQALHFPGNPAAMLQFAEDPASCANGADGVPICRMSALDVDVLVGGRYNTTPSDTACTSGPTGGGAGEGYVQSDTPWLVPGFETGTHVVGNDRRRIECRERAFPYGAAFGTDRAALNWSAAAANPIADGRSRVRRMELIDGVMVDQAQMIILFREHFESFLGDDDPNGFSAYGLIRLSRGVTELDPLVDYDGNQATESRVFNDTLGDLTCASDVITPYQGAIDGYLTTAGGTFTPLTDADDAAVLANLILFGQASTPLSSVIFPDDQTPSQHVHWYCEATGLIDGGKDGKIPCPGGSDVRFFIVDAPVDGSIDALDIAGDACNTSFSVSVKVNNDVQWSKCPGNGSGCDCTTGDCDSCELASGNGIYDETFFDDATLSGCFPNVTDTQNNFYDVTVVNPGTCLTRIQQWADDDDDGNGDGIAITMDPSWRCAADGTGARPTFCSIGFEPNGAPSIDQRLGKEFYPAGEAAAVSTSLRDETNLAFRYKSQFRSRSGKSIGFAPEICVPNASTIPFCYAPDTIEVIAKRTECLTELYATHRASSTWTDGGVGIESGLRYAVRDALRMNFASEEITTNPFVPGQILAYPIVNEGFERLFAELVITLGDESFTKAFASRFDLAGASQLSFEGSKQEIPGGVDLAGGAGFEMVTLYRAVQYYELALDRFYRMAPSVWTAASTYGDVTGDNFVDGKTVAVYMDRLIRASTQKARAMSEISKRYQDFNEPVLARRVIERGYSAAYMESVVLSQLMKKIGEKVPNAEQRQIQKSIEDAQLTYRSALLRMQTAYDAISDDVRFFGYAPDYIPFPALETDEFFLNEGAFDVMLARSRTLIDVAADKEDFALDSSRAYEEDAAAFQAELVNIRNGYEAELANICGSFIGPDDRVYPAITRYAHLDDQLRYVGDPCGLVSDGDMSTAVTDIAISTFSVRSAVQALRDQEVRLQIVKTEVGQRCELIGGIANFRLAVDQQVDAYENYISQASAHVENMDRWSGLIMSIAGNFIGIDTTDIPFVDVAVFLTSTASATALATASSTLTLNSANFQSKIEELETNASFWETLQECEFAKLDANSRTRELLLDGYHLNIAATQAELALSNAVGTLDGLQKRAKRLQDELEEAYELAINIEAARNDPNVRIYKNDAILTADRTFERAIRQAYAATKVYEYYTSTSYALLGELFLIRLVSRGDLSLEQYMDELEDAFLTFEEQFGNPDLRVMVVSAKDDILGVPRTDVNDLPFSQDERSVQFRNELTRSDRIDENGYVSLTFPIRLDGLSPLTRTHKVFGIEAEVLGDDDDQVFRVYVRQRGTGVVRSVDDEKLYFAFPSRTAVVNAFMNGERPFADSIYRNHRLRDRPLANTQWELVVNLNDETDNLDLDLSSLSDIRLFFYYTDFTAL